MGQIAGTIQANIYIPAELRRQGKVIAAALGIPFYQLIAEALQEKIAKHTDSESRKALDQLTGVIREDEEPAPTKKPKKKLAKAGARPARKSR